MKRYIEGNKKEKLLQRPADQHIAIVEKFQSIINQPERLNKRYKALNGEKKKTLYLGIFIKIAEAVEISDIDRLKKLDKLISCINSIEKKKVLLETFYNNDNNPIKSTNLIILACKHNRPEVLNYLFNKQTKVLDNLSTAIKRNQIRIIDVDEQGHTACYYAIRSNNVHLLKILIKTDNFFHDLHSTKLDDLLSKDYEELKLRNVEISEIMQIFIENRLIREHFFHRIINTNNLSITDDINAQDTFLTKIDVIYKQINMTLIAINNFTESLREGIDLDLSKTLFIARFIAKNIRILKRQLKSTYNQLPWEEIEFYLSRYFCLSTLERKNLHGHLIKFADKLRRVFNYSNDLNDNKVNEIKNKIKKFIDSGIPRNREKVSGFESLYKDYELIKDPYSLNKMLHYIELALSVSPKEQSGRFIIQRTLQVIGEYLKDSPQSPHLSDSIEKTLIQMEMATIIEIAPSLRNLLSHNNNLDRLYSRNSIEKEEGFFTKIHDDLRKIKGVIIQVFYNVKIRQFKKWCEDIISNNDYKKVKELSDEFIKKADLEKTELVDNKTHNTDVLKKMENLVRKMRQIINSRIELENGIIKPIYTINLEGEDNNEKLFIKIESIIASEKNKITDIRTNYNAHLETIRDIVYFIKMSANKDSDNYLKETKKQYQNILNLIRPNKLSVNLWEIKDLIKEILNNIKEHNRFKEILSLASEIEFIIYFEGIRSNEIVAFKEKLDTEIDTFLEEYIYTYRVESELDDVLNIFKSEVKNEEKYQKLQSALEYLKQICNTKLLLVDHFKDKIKLTQQEYSLLVNVLDETEDKKRELFNYFNFKGNRDKGKKLMKKSQDHYGNFVEGEKDFNKLLKSLQFKSNHEKLLRSIFDEKKLLHKDYTPESLLNDTINDIKVQLTNAEYKELIEKLENKKQAHKAKQKLIDFFEDNIEMTEIEYRQLVDKLYTTPMNKAELNKLYSSLHKAILAVESLNDSYGAFIKAVTEKEITINEIYNSFNKLSDSLQLGSNDKELLKKIFKERKIKIFENYFSEKLSLLKKRLENVNCGSKHELILYYKHNKKLQAEVEMLLLDLSGISSNIDQSPLRCLEKEFLSLDGDFPFLMGVPLRNYLAHGDALIDSLPFDPLIAVISNALIFAEEGESIIALKNLVKDSKMKEYLISKVNDNVVDQLCKEKLPTELQQHTESIIILQQSDYWIDYLKNMFSNKGKGTNPMVKSDVASCYDTNLKLLISQKELFDAVQQNDKQVLENCLKRGDEIEARDSKMWTPLHTAADKGYKDVVETLLNNGANVNSITKDKSTPLHLAAIAGQYLVVKVLLKKGAKVTAKNIGGFKPLHDAALHGHKEVVEILLSHDADINSEGRDGHIPLHFAAFNGNVDVIKFLVEKKDTDVNAKCKNGSTPLHYAALATHNKANVVEYLLGKGAIVDSEDNEKKTPLHGAACIGNKDIVETLLNNGANVHSVTADKETPLHLAAIFGHDQVIEVLFNSGASVDAKNKDGYTSLHFATMSTNSKTIEYLLNKGTKVDIKAKDGMIPLHLATDNLDAVKSLIIIGRSDINTLDNYNKSPLHCAVQQNNLNVIRFLVENGANVNAPDKRDHIPLHYWGGYEYGDVDIVGYLVDKGVDLNTPEGNGLTLLHAVAANGCLSAVEYIVGKKAQVNVHDNNGMIPLHLAALCGYLNVIEFLVKNDADVNALDNRECTSLHYAAEHGHNKVVKFLLDKGAKIVAKDKYGKSSLFLATKAGHIKVVNTLLEEAKKDKNIVNDPDKNKRTPLHVAASEGYKNIVKLLLENKASLNISDKNGMTPLHFATSNGNLSVIKLLVRKGANVHALSNKKCTPLHRATQYGHKDVIMILLKNGANVNVADSKKNTPLHFATWEGYAEIVEILLLHGAEVNCSNDHNITPLHAAVNNGHYQAFDILLKYVKEKFPDKLSQVVNVIDDNAVTPLHIAANNSCYQIVEILLSSKADIDAADKFGSTSLNLAADRGDVQIVSILLQNGANVNCGNNKGITPLHSAAKGGHHEVTKILLNHNANVTAADNEKSTPLHYAAVIGHEKTVEVLLNSGAEVNLSNEHNMTPLDLAIDRSNMKTIELLLKKVCKNPLHFAAANNFLNLVKYCINSGYNVNAVDQHKVTSLHIASFYGSVHIVEFLTTENGVDVNAVDAENRTSLNLAADNGYVKIVQILLSNGAKVDIGTKKGVTPLHCAAKNGHKNVVEILLNKEANIKVIEKYGNTPLHYAAEGGHKDTIKVLLENGAHINIQNNDGKTPLYYATNDSIKSILASTKELFTQVKKGDLQKTKDCLSKGAVVNAQGIDGGRPLHYAAWKGYVEITEVLLKNKANPNYAGKNGYMPLHYAAQFGNLKIVQLLLDNQADPTIQDKNGKTPLDLAKDSENDDFKIIKGLLSVADESTSPELS